MTGPVREGAVGLEVLRYSDGRSFVAVDSLVDMFADVAATMDEGPARNSMQALADTFRPMSTYAELEANVRGDDDGSALRARYCECGRPVIDGKRIAGTPVTVDANPVADGTLFPFRIDRGVPTLAPWTAKLDGIGGTTAVRLTEHACAAGDR